MFFIVSKYLTPRGFHGITFFPFVFIRDEKNKEDVYFINHESIHIRQQKEMLIVLFFVWYGLEYLFRLLQFRNQHKAYYNISFEREAYKKEKDLDYLKKRSFWAFLKYL
ncbi:MULTISPECIES: hypothetical protein [Flavobacterium]|uniref:Peptidase M56 domain-containing protein n=2 Tax=Flavobacterium TaxID=237 RepID=A0A2N9PAT0_9FLAO|nr:MULTISPECIES: hypothetical protein [Flavobacterium]QYS88415.1 hypothetical protein JJC05_12045 [Flavobacterium davisii]RVU89657.1 hypothetical protein EH230_12830 [Flavobacterium columnare]SPE77437.1 hypothetical protein FLACOL_01430 [Flavobacterium columnare]